MTELKTLKDIEWDLGLIPKNKLEKIDERVEPLFNYKQKLKQEAIKWLRKVDHPIQDREVKDILGLVTIEADNCLYGVRRFLIYFFNITEEEYEAWKKCLI